VANLGDQGNRVLQELLVMLGPLENKAIEGLRDKQGHKVKQDHWALLASQDQADSQDLEENQDLVDKQGNQVTRDNREVLDNKDLLDSLETEVHLVIPDPLDHKDHEDKQDKMVHQEFGDQQESKATKDLLVHWDNPDNKDSPDKLDSRELLESKVHRVLVDQEAQMVNQVFQDHQELQGLLVAPVQLDLKDPKDL
jgi:hypothetical protein